AWLLRLSVLVSFISESILTGVKAGAALVIASTQLPKLFGVPGGGDDFFDRVGRLVRPVPDTNPLLRRLARDPAGHERGGEGGGGGAGRAPTRSDKRKEKAGGPPHPPPLPPAGGGGDRGGGGRPAPPRPPAIAVCASGRRLTVAFPLPSRKPASLATAGP